MVGALLALAASAALAAPITVDDLLTVTDIGGLSASPDGRTIAFRTERASLAANRIETRWWLMRVGGAAPPQPLVDGGEALIGGAGVVEPEHAVWSADGRHLIIRRAGADGLQLRAVDVRSGHARTLTHAVGDVTDFALSSDGDAVDYTEGPPRALIRATERRLHDSGARVDDSVDLSVGVVGGAWSLGRSQSVRLTGDWFDRRGLLAKSGRRGWRQALSGGPPRRQTPVPPAPAYLPPDPSLTAQVCVHLDCHVTRIDAIVPVPALRASLVTTRGAEPRQTLRLLDAAGFRTVYAADGLVSGSRQQSDPCVVAGVTALCVLAAADAPPRLVAISLASGHASTVYTPNQALAQRTRGVATRFAWRDTQGRDFVGQLFAPSGARPASGYPLVVQYYWCDGFLRGGQGDELPMATLSGKGIAVLCINKRSRGETLQDSVADYRLAVSGIAAAVDRLSTTGLIDRRRVGMQGLSFGSQVTMWVASNTQLLHAAAIASGQVEPVSYWYGARPNGDFAARLKEGWGLDDPDRFPGPWLATTAAKRADQIQVPLLMQLPESEARWSIELYAKLRRSPTPVELYAFSDAAHVKALPRQKAAAYARTLAWFRFWLQGKVEADPFDPDRAARWAGLAARFRQSRAATQSSASTSSSSRM